MMRIKPILLLSIALILMPACSHKIKRSNSAGTTSSIAGTEITKARSVNLIDTHWSLTKINNTMIENPAVNLREAYLVFMPDSTSITGSGGCNSLFGNYHLKPNNRIEIERIGSTKMYCDGMDNEIGMLNALHNADAYSIEGDTLTLKKGGKIPVLSFCVKNDAKVE